MTDRELLELAAKAIGQDTHDAMRADWLNGHSTYWNPLADDGDAFRLAVELDIVPRHINGVAFAWKDGICDMQEPVVDADPYTATRRAIVRAAAEIGKQMEEVK